MEFSPRQAGLIRALLQGDCVRRNPSPFSCFIRDTNTIYDSNQFASQRSGASKQCPVIFPAELNAEILNGTGRGRKLLMRNNANRHRRGAEQHLGCKGLDPEPVDRLRAHESCACRRLHSSGKIADFAALYHVRTGCHGATDLSPVTMAAALHFGLAINNFGIQEHMPHSEQTDEVFPHNYRFEAGYMYPVDPPGPGVDLDEKLAEKYPYESAYLPVNRKLDGTLFDWLMTDAVLSAQERACI
jgi:hypothetical protein